MRLAACSDRARHVRRDARLGATRVWPTVTITAAKGCELDRTEFAAGGITFTDREQGRDRGQRGRAAVRRAHPRREGERAAGLGGQFAVTLDAGHVHALLPRARRPSARTHHGDRARPRPATTTLAALLAQGTDGLQAATSTPRSATSSTPPSKLATALHGTDLAAAQRAYIAARPFYEKIEPVAESFVNGTQNLDADIDARANDVPASQWSGFHRIEKGLFQDKSAGRAGHAGATGSSPTCRSCSARPKALTYQPTDLANGAAGPARRGRRRARSPARRSGTRTSTCVDMANNVEGAEQAFAAARAGAEEDRRRRSPRTIAARFTALDNVHRQRTARTGNASGYVLYTDARPTPTAARSPPAVKAVQEPLSRVAGKVANA